MRRWPEDAFAAPAWLAAHHHADQPAHAAGPAAVRLRTAGPAGGGGLRLAGVAERPSLISVPGARALWLEEARGPPEAFMIGQEFAHLHPGPDQSLHIMLPPQLAEEAIEAGWAEQHPVARRGLIPANAVMVYAPRDDEERDVVEQLVRASHAFARGSPA